MACLASNLIVMYLVVLVVSILLTYTLAVCLNHSNAILPFLGYLGDRPVESTLFTQLFVVIAVLYSLIVQVQYVWVASLLGPSEVPTASSKTNIASACFGHIGAAGMFVLACFQESNVFYVYHIAEFSYLLASVIYFLLQTVIHKALPTVNSSVGFGFKAVLNVFMFILFLAFASSYVVAVKMFKKPWEKRLIWGVNDGGWPAYIVSAASQWLLIILFQVYVLTFITNFRFISLTNASIVVSNPSN